MTILLEDEWRESFAGGKHNATTTAVVKYTSANPPIYNHSVVPGFALLLGLMYLLLFLACLFQLSRLIYYKYRLIHYQSMFLFLCLLWCAFRWPIFLFAGAFDTACASNAVSIIDNILFYYAINIQFATFSLLIIYFGELVHRSTWRSLRRKQFVAVYIAINLFFFFWSLGFILSESVLVPPSEILYPTICGNNGPVNPEAPDFHLFLSPPSSSPPPPPYSHASSSPLLSSSSSSSFSSSSSSASSSSFSSSSFTHATRHVKMSNDRKLAIAEKCWAFFGAVLSFALVGALAIYGWKVFQTLREDSHAALPFSSRSANSPTRILILSGIVMVCYAARGVYDVVSAADSGAANYNLEASWDWNPSGIVFILYIVWEIIPLVAVIGFFWKMPSRRQVKPDPETPNEEEPLLLFTNPIPTSINQSINQTSIDADTSFSQSVEGADPIYFLPTRSAGASSVDIRATGFTPYAVGTPTSLGY